VVSGGIRGALSVQDALDPSSSRYNLSFMPFGRGWSIYESLFSFRFALKESNAVGVGTVGT